MLSALAPLGLGRRFKMNYDGDKCGDLHMSTDDWYMGGCHDGTNQKFYFETWPLPARLKTLEASKPYCLDWHMDNNNLYWGGCHDGDNQKAPHPCSAPLLLLALA